MIQAEHFLIKTYRPQHHDLNAELFNLGSDPAQPHASDMILTLYVHIYLPSTLFHAIPFTLV